MLVGAVADAAGYRPTLALPALGLVVAALLAPALLPGRAPTSDGGRSR